MALTVSKKKVEGTAPVATEATTEVKDVNIRAKAKAEAVAPTFDEAKLGCLSDALTFVAPLGDPSHPDTTTDKEGNKTVTPYIVGYRFKANKDLEVPDCGLDSDARKNLMSYIPEKKNNKKVVKAGETVDLTRFEAALLLASVEFNGRISGDGKEFLAVYQNSRMGSKKGTVGTTSTATALPTFALKFADSTGSIKDFEIIKVLSYTTEEVGKDKNGTPITRKKRVINPGFEKWEPLCTVQTSTKSAGGTRKTPANRRNANAEAFLQLVSRK